MKLNMCPICKNAIGPSILSASALDVYNSEKYIYGRCHECDLLILLNLPDEEKKVDYTASGYYQRSQTKGRWLIDNVMSMFIAYRISLVHKLTSQVTLKGKHLLDIGCGKGKFLVSAKRDGAHVLGLEPTLRSFEFARVVLGDSVQNKMMDKDLFASNTFDLITMWHVLMHVLMYFDQMDCWS